MLYECDIVANATILLYQQFSCAGRDPVFHVSLCRELQKNLSRMWIMWDWSTKYELKNKSWYTSKQYIFVTSEYILTAANHLTEIN